MSKTNPLVSVIIPTYKRSESLPKAINSVLAQSYDNIEIIIVDDNDPDTDYRKMTEHRMSLYEDNDKVFYIKHPYNKNGSAARNTGFRASKGSYIMYLDDDDEFLPIKVEAQVKLLENSDCQVGACYTFYKRYKGDSFHSQSTQIQENSLKEALSRDLWTQPGSNLMVKRHVVEDIGGFDESFKRNQDEEFQIKILKKYKIECVPIFGLIVHLETQYRYFDFEAINNHFINCFKDLISEFSHEDQRDIYQKLYLQVFRDFIFDKHSFLKAIRLITEGKITFINSIFYILYLISRKFNKRCYPYSLK